MSAPAVTLSNTLSPEEALRRFIEAFDIGLDSEARYKWMQRRLGVHRGARVASAYLQAVRTLRARFTSDQLGPTFPTCLGAGAE